MTDMLVRLYPESNPKLNVFRAKAETCQIKRALAIDMQPLTQFIEDNFSDICPGWVDEARACLQRHPTTCFIAVESNKVVGFACYDSTAKGMVGPVGVTESRRHNGIARALLNHCFQAMLFDGYAYAVIGWVSSEDFYSSAFDAISIQDSEPGIYQRMINA